MPASAKVARLQLLVLFAFFSIFSSFAQQNNPLINSGEVISLGLKKYEEKNYKEAIKLYNQVNKSDTNYILALTELGNAYILDSQNLKALETAQLGMNMFPEKYSSFMMQAANAMDNLGMWEESQKLYDSAIKRNPHNFLLYYNKAITNYNAKKFDVAKSYFQQSLLINPYYTPSHFYLAGAYLNEGSLVPAMLGYSTYLLMSPSGTHKASAISLLSSISKAEDGILEFVKLKNTASEKSFNAIQDILLSKVAYDPKYKSLADIDDVMIKQIQVVMEKLEYKASDKGFVMQYYVPFFIQTFQEKNFEPLVYTMFSDVDLKSIQNWNKKNKNDVEKFAAKAIEYFNEIKFSRVLNADERKKNELIYVYNNNELLARGIYKKVNNEMQAQGKWIFFTDEGGIKLDGEFGAGEQKHGVWTSYYNSGKIKEKFTYNNGELNGKAEGWFENGNKWYEEFYKNGLLEGKQIINYYNSKLKTDFNFKAGLKTGEQKYYNNKGELTDIAFFKDDKLEGPYKSFYESGKKKVESSYSNDEENGVYKSYFESGQLYQTGKIENSKREGLWTNYYEDGAIESKTTYVGNEITGEYTEYYNNGTLSSKGSYAKKKLDGKVIYNDEDGKMYCEALYDKGKLKEIAFYDKSGKQISSTSTKRGAAHIVFYGAGGNKIGEGDFDKDGSKQGKYTEYYSTGIISDVSNWKDGELHGPSVSYMPNGKVSTETNYKNGSEDGYSKTYFLNGQIKNEGWVVNGDKQQTWLNYNLLGDLLTKEYFSDGSLNGYTQYYYPGNILDYEFLYKNGWIEQVSQVDTTGKLIQNNLFPGGNGKIIFRHYNGKILSETDFRFYHSHGKKQSYFFDGTPSTVMAFENDRKEGKYTSYFYGGQVKSEGNYKADNKEGVWKSYYADGKIFDEETYKDGKIEGTWKGYYPDGSLNLTIEYKKGSVDGDYIYYGANNEKAVILNFKNGKIESYQFETAPGKRNDPVLLKNYSGQIKAFYPNGKPSAEFKYFENNVDGEIKIFYSNGNVKSEGTMINGYFNGVRKTYYPDGKPYRVENYVIGQLHGKRTTFNPDGTLLSEELFYDGDFHGASKYINPKTKKSSTRHYYYGFSVNAE